MAQSDSDGPLLPSLLDRLIDREPDVSSEPLWKSSYTVRDLKEDVRRDLEYLLNARHTRGDLMDTESEIARSVLTYGLPDLSWWMDGSPEAREQLRLLVERIVRTFEPRLTHVQVTVLESDLVVERKIELLIHAVLRVDPIAEPVTFDTVIQSATGVVAVQTKS